MRKWYTMKADAKKAEITIYDMIGKDWWSGEGVDAASFHEDLKALGDVTEITLRVNSPGGVVTDGVAIYNLLDQHPAKVTAMIDGIAASAASLIVMAADEIVMPDNSFMLVHEPRGFAMGTADDMVAIAQDLERMTEVFANTYAKRSGKMDTDAIKALLKEDRLMTASEAIDKGFADRTSDPIPMAASFDMARVPPTMRSKIAPFFTAKATEPAAPAAPVEPAVDTTATTNVVNLDDVRSEAARTASAHAVEIAEICALAGKPGETAKMLSARKTPAEVRALMLESKALQDEKIVLRTTRAAAPEQKPTAEAAASWGDVHAGVKKLMDFGKRK